MPKSGFYVRIFKIKKEERCEWMIYRFFDWKTHCKWCFRSFLNLIHIDYSLAIVKIQSIYHGSQLHCIASYLGDTRRSWYRLNLCSRVESIELSWNSKTMFKVIIHLLIYTDWFTADLFCLWMSYGSNYSSIDPIRSKICL